MPKKASKKILIVEDDKDFASILKMKFESEGFCVVLAKDGQEGIDMADSEKPDLIFSDMLLPRVNGIDMAKTIREAKNKAEIIFLTNLEGASYAKESGQSEKFEYLIKSDVRISDIVSKAKEKLA